MIAMNVFCGMSLLLGAVLLVGCSAKGSLTDDGSSEAIVVIDDDVSAWGVDPTWIESAKVTGSHLTLSVTYSGGCKHHSFALVGSESFASDEPARLGITLAHDGNGDTCEAALTERLAFDLAPIATHAQRTVGLRSGHVELLLKDNPSGELWFTFGAAGGRN